MANKTKKNKNKNSKRTGKHYNAKFTKIYMEIQIMEFLDHGNSH